MLQDHYGRRFSYLRLSITDVCNFRCTYCLPDGYLKPDVKKQFLSVEEIATITRVFAKFGLKKIRITGGEPSLRPDLPQIISQIKRTAGVEKVVMTSNGYKLPQRINSWVDAGLDSLNISVDSLRPEMFAAITGMDRLQEILKGIDEAKNLNLPIKVNAVLMKTFNLNDMDRFLDWVKHKNVSLRFIELMETGEHKPFFDAQHTSGQQIMDSLLEKGWQKTIKKISDGPAIELFHPDYLGRIGFILPYGNEFCASCNRLRVSSTGKLHLCLFGDDGYDLRPYLHDDEALANFILECMDHKTVSHQLGQNQTGQTTNLSIIGG